MARLLLTISSLLCAAILVHAQDAVSVLERIVTGQVLSSPASPSVTIDVDSEFDYVGGQRFILRGHTDVEQHFFIDADDVGAVSRMFWFQFERMLPHNDGQYSYPPADSVVLGGLTFIAHVRRYDQEPVDDSDRGAAYRYLESRGYFVPTPALRARYVHIPDGDRREELMIVFLKAEEASGEITPDVREAIIAEGRDGLSIESPR